MSSIPNRSQHLGNPIIRSALRCLTACTLLAVAHSASAQTVFINEIHYDNSGGDIGEAIEIAGPAGTDLGTYSIVLYNGSTQEVYGTTGLSGVIPDQDNGFGTLVMNYPPNGLQNGSPDGIALVNNGGVVQFLSYEGSFTAIDGPATGMTSIDILVEETFETLPGQSLQLVGSGNSYSDFTWLANAPSSFGLTNAGQAFINGPPAEPEIVINEIDYDQPGTDTAEFVELKNVGPFPANLENFTLQLVNGSNNGVYAVIDLPPALLNPGEHYVICADAATTPNCDLDVAPDSNLIQNGSPDAVVLWMDGSVMDAVSYEGNVIPPFVEGSGAGLEDLSSVAFAGISRYPDGVDTDQNNIDLTLRCITPGDANSGASTECPDPLGPPPEPVFSVIINEIHADPANDLPGDANGDGTRDFGDDEFVEIVNVSGALLDLSGWTISDGAGLRHTFPGGSVIENECAVVVFGGGAPSGGFGGALVQTASTAALGLNNSGDSISIRDGAQQEVSFASYGAEGGNDQSLNLDPDVTGNAYTQHSLANGSGGTLYSPGTRVDGTPFAGCDAPPPPLELIGEIFEIQGAGLASPFVGERVSTFSNVVTAVGPQGFAIQTPDNRDDGDINTSNGIYVFTGGAPTVAVGDVVDVAGDAVEFFDMTQISGNPVVTVVGAGAPLPAPVVLDANTPSPDPALPSCAIEYECYEGMLVSVTNGTVTSPNQAFSSDPIAEFYITAGDGRTFRGPGLEYPGQPGIPVWDGNPEVFELDPDKLGLPNVLVTTGSRFSATGIIGFEFGDYEIWASSLDILEEAPVGAPVRDQAPTEATLGSLNMFRLFDNIDDPPGSNAFGEPTNDTVVSAETYQTRLAKLALYIVGNMKTPDIIGVQEVESQKVLDDVAAAVEALAPGAGYVAYLTEGNDIGGIDVGFLVRSSRVKVIQVLQMGADETYLNPADGLPDLLHDRPPLVLRARILPDGLPLYVMVLHNRSLGSIETERVQVKRLEQAQSIARMVEQLQGSDRHMKPVVVVGDFNAFEFSDGYVDTVGHIRGVFDPAESIRSGDDLVDPDFMNQVLGLPEEERYSFIFEGNSQVLDHALTNLPLDLRITGMEFARGNADAPGDLINDPTTPLRSSDHDGFVLFFDSRYQKPRSRAR